VPLCVPPISVRDSVRDAPLQDDLAGELDAFLAGFEQLVLADGFNR